MHEWLANSLGQHNKTMLSLTILYSGYKAHIRNKHPLNPDIFSKLQYFLNKFKMSVYTTAQDQDQSEWSEWYAKVWTTDFQLRQICSKQKMHNLLTLIGTVGGGESSSSVRNSNSPRTPVCLLRSSGKKRALYLSWFNRGGLKKLENTFFQIAKSRILPNFSKIAHLSKKFS